MKHKEIFMGFLLLIFTIGLFFVANNYDKKKALEKRENSNEEFTQKEIKDSGPKYFDNERIIIIGDSRMYGASKVVNDEGIIFVAKNGARCNYLWESAEIEVDKFLEENPEEHFTIFVNLGVNDLDIISQGAEPDGKNVCNMEQYANYYKTLKEKWAAHNLFFTSVNPVDEEILKTGKFKDSKMTDNEKISEFNEYLFKELHASGIYYCNTYDVLMEKGFESPDGLHYSNETSKEIVKLVKECNQVKKQEKEEKESKMLLIFNFFKEMMVISK